MKNENIKPKPEFLEKMKKLLQDPRDFGRYKKILQEPLLNSIRCNTLKISPEQLKKQLEEKGWKISQIWKNYPEVMIIENELHPGELGRSIEHQLGYYYVQELVSMLPIIALNPRSHELVLDVCASPGSKTSQMASKMDNTGTIIANDINIGRIKILASNLERCGSTNAIITRDDGIRLCEKFKLNKLKFDKILLDAPCSGEGTIRSSKKSAIMWNPNTIKSLSKLQKKLFKSAFEILKINGEMIYSTCTHAPEENESIVDFALKEFGDKIEIERINLPVKYREGITEWASDFARLNHESKFEKSERGRELNEKYDEKVKLSCRIYPHDNNTEGFFLAKFRRTRE